MAPQSTPRVSPGVGPSAVDLWDVTPAPIPAQLAGWGWGWLVPVRLLNGVGSASCSLLQGRTQGWRPHCPVPLRPHKGPCAQHPSPGPRGAGRGSAFGFTSLKGFPVGTWTARKSLVQRQHVWFHGGGFGSPEEQGGVSLSSVLDMWLVWWWPLAVLCHVPGSQPVTVGPIWLWGQLPRGDPAPPRPAPLPCGHRLLPSALAGSAGATSPAAAGFAFRHVTTLSHVPCPSSLT